jgi:hypothetical protein
MLTVSRPMATETAADTGQTPPPVTSVVPHTATGPKKTKTNSSPRPM